MTYLRSVSVALVRSASANAPAPSGPMSVYSMLPHGEMAIRTEHEQSYRVYVPEICQCGVGAQRVGECTRSFRADVVVVDAAIR